MYKTNATQTENRPTGRVITARPYKIFVPINRDRTPRANRQPNVRCQYEPSYKTFIKEDEILQRELLGIAPDAPAVYKRTVKLSLPYIPWAPAIKSQEWLPPRQVPGWIKTERGLGVRLEPHKARISIRDQVNN